MNAVMLAALLLGQQQAPPPPQAPPLRLETKAHPDCGCGYGGICRCDDGLSPNNCHCDGVLPNQQAPSQAPPVKTFPLSYAEGAAQAVKLGRPLVAFVGVGTSRPIPGAVVCQQDYGIIRGFEDDYPAVIVAVPDGDWLTWRATLKATATDAQIRAALAPGQVQPVAAPFAPSSKQPRSAGPDADVPDEVSSILRGLEPYRSARFTQVSGNRSGRGSNSLAPRQTLGQKWMVPGGLEGIRGWTNQLYRGPKNPVTSWFGRANPTDTFITTDGSLWGSEFIHQRQYEDGAKFADVLRTDRGVFEVRVAERSGGEWGRSIPYRDQSAEPAGYVRVSLQKCASCHDQAGAGSYGAARIPGGGGVLSDPFPQLER